MADLRDGGRTLPLAADEGRLGVLAVAGMTSGGPKDGARVLTAGEAGRQPEKTEAGSA